ncbi:MAG: hypothetical protein N2439_01570 [Anaerolineae bacterium]|nr:hypothetical protein [Anaerolineae bacterium]
MLRISLVAAALALAAASAAFAQAGDPNTMKCVEYAALDAEGKAQLMRALSEALGQGNEVNADLARKVDETCQTNPEMTVAAAAGQ